MAELNIDFDVINSTAISLKSINFDLDNKFQDIRDAVMELYDEWISKNSDASMVKFNNIEKLYRYKRFNSFDEYINFLIQPVREGYIDTENKNVNIADKFE